MQIREHFPFFKSNPNLIYLDSAATSQKPQMVIDETFKYLTQKPRTLVEVVLV
jgi:selenocysteine lyase/cysteine desulfurase